MKKLIFLLIFLQLSICFAQRSNGGRRGGGNDVQTSEKREIPKFEAKKAAGILEYKTKKVLKKLKLKNSDSISKAIAIHIESYNTEINKIKIINKDLFEGLDVVVNQNTEAAIRNKNREVMQETRKMTEEKLGPIRNEIKTHQEQLNSSLESILTEKQNKKWLTYQKTEREKLRPKKPQGNNARKRSNNGSGQQGRRRGN